jgi:RimJ/RimL family protein N-acetyltransferase
VTQLRIRDARDQDRKAVLEFCKRTWAGYGDYISRIWHRWIRDPGGRFIVAELDGRPVGIAKIDDFGSGEVWLEGLRVAPEHRGKGIANAINMEVLRTLRRIRAQRVRFSTGATNRASRTIGSKFGFTVAAHFRYYWQRTRWGMVRGEKAGMRLADAVYDYMVQSRFLRLSSGLVGEGWVFRELTPDLLRRYVKEGRVWTVTERGALAGVALYQMERAELGLSLGFIDGDPGAITVLARNCIYMAARRGDKHCSASVPSRFYARALERAGYDRKESIGQIVYQYSGTRPSSPRKQKR